MRKILLPAALFMGLTLIFSCKTQSPATETSAVEDALKNTYDRYRGSLILDGAETHNVVYGDTLNGIARVKYESTGYFYPLILLASSDVVADQDKLLPGMKLIVPNLQRNLDDAKARAALKSFLLEVAVIEDSRNRHGTAEGLRNKAATL